MAEWSIAPVLKTDVLKGTGGSNPSLSARNQEQRKLLLILFYVDTESLLTSRHIKQNQHKHRQVVADFLQRNTKQGWASEAKPIPTQLKEEGKHRRWLPDFLQRNTQKGMGEQSEANPYPTERRR